MRQKTIMNVDVVHKKRKFENEMLKFWFVFVLIAFIAWVYFLFLSPLFKDAEKNDIYNSLIRKTNTSQISNMNNSRYYDNRIQELNTIINKLSYERDIILSQISGDNISIDDSDIVTGSIAAIPKTLSHKSSQKFDHPTEIIQRIVALEDENVIVDDSSNHYNTLDSLDNIVHKNVTQTYFGLFLGTHQSIAVLRDEWESVKKIKEIDILNLSATSVKSPGDDGRVQLVLGPLRNAQDAMGLCRLLRKKEFECQFGNFPNN